MIYGCCCCIFPRQSEYLIFCILSSLHPQQSARNYCNHKHNSVNTVFKPSPQTIDNYVLWGDRYRMFTKLLAVSLMKLSQSPSKIERYFIFSSEERELCFWFGRWLIVRVYCSDIPVKLVLLLFSFPINYIKVLQWRKKKEELSRDKLQ